MRSPDLERLREHMPPALMPSLEMAVPLRILELAGTTFGQRDALAKVASQHIAEHGDALMFASPKGQTSAAWAQLVTGLAVAAYQPGGVTFAGAHWCVDHAECERAEAAAERAWNGESDGGPVFTPVETVRVTGDVL